MRLFTAISWFFKILAKGDAAFAEAPVAGAAKPQFAASPAPGVQVLALLQSEGRLVDFLMEDVASYEDADIGAAVRDIHRGCRKVLTERFTLRRIMNESEGSRVTINGGFDPSQISMHGNLTSPPPYSGVLVHGGWYVEEAHLPTVPAGADPMVVAPAQVEVK